MSKDKLRNALGIPMSDEKFVNHHGLLCPFCQSNEISFVGLCIENKNICLSCGKKWAVVLKITGYKESK